MRNYRNFLGQIDWFIVLLWVLLMLLGWGNIYSAVHNEEHSSIFDISQRYGKQMMWIASSIFLFLIVMALDANLYHTLAYPLYIISLIALFLVLIIGTEISGARSWFVIGGFSLQPAEFAKFTTSLALARFLSRHGTELQSWRYQLGALALAFLPAILILPQPDLGSVLVYLAFFLVMYREGLPSIYLVLGFTFALLFVISLLVPLLYVYIGLGIIGLLMLGFLRKKRRNIFRVLAALVVCAGFVQSVDYTFNNLLEDRHRNRINILLGKAEDPQGIGYNTHQSIIAIGSGGLTGKGYLEGTQTKFDFVPEQTTDFIFCTVGEEWGLLGTSALVLLYTVFFIRLVILAERQKSAFSRIYGYSVVAIFFVHFGINIAMTIGLAPVIGIPLPFFSYGGSSLWGFTVLLAIFIRLDAHRNHHW